MTEEKEKELTADAVWLFTLKIVNPFLFPGYLFSCFALYSGFEISHCTNVNPRLMFFFWIFAKMGYQLGEHKRLVKIIVFLSKVKVLYISLPVVKMGLKG